jgi:tagatose 1,6-diphosphate aldolase
MSKTQITIGKYRGMQQIAGEDGIFTMVALDHQETVREGLKLTDPDSVSDAEVIAVKLDIVAALAPHSSALLLDLRYGAGPAIAAGALPGRTGLVVTLELSPGFGPGETIARKTSLVPGWNVAKIRRMGAAGVKLIVYYHPESKTAGFQEDLIRQVAADCREHDIPLVLECLVHPVVPGMAKESPEFAATRPWAVIESARRLCPLGADLYKAEFPSDARFEKDGDKMLDWCRELSNAAGVPWVVLSAAVSHDVFCRQVDIACRGGASGFLAGRSIWKEALETQGPARQAFLRGEAVRRLDELSAIARRSAQPWTGWFETTAGPGWHERY